MLKKLGIFILLFIVPLSAFSTHIVGGVLNYAYNGNNIYTITLKLFRDCGSGTASFPNSITIQVRGNNGANFSPTKNLSINIGAVTSVTAPIDPCGIPPNPMPCVQQAVYTKTISLPPNTGGYHLYYGLQARNLSLTNINASCNCIGESFYAYIPDNTNSANNNSNPVFNSFPPLFLCVNKFFSFNHAATDANGDSLVYSLYRPYNDNAPTFSNNVAYFTPVNYVSGFTYTTPLGASPFTINPVTGVLTGSPGIVGQFVVGVKVREYRNGVFISETLRDFQFNVLNCPAPPPQLAVANQTINNGCSKVVVAQGIAINSASWTSIFPGSQGTYNNYMSCTVNCLTNTILAVGTPPSYADFKVCGTATTCLGGTVCDTFRVHFQPPLSVSIAPQNPALCNGQTSTTITAIGSGGTPPYAYLWNNINPSQMITVGVGTYNVRLSDASGCPPAYATAVVTSYSVPVTINAVSNLTRCVTNPLAALGATVTGASGVLWSGGTGTFSPNNTSSSNVFYTPSGAELAAGSVTLSVTTTGSGSCPPATDTVVITYSNFSGTVVATPTAVSCFSGTNGAVSLSVTGGQAPHSYTWQVSPVQTGSLLSNRPAGTYSFTVGDNIGCFQQGSVAITQPAILGLSFSVTNASCFNSATGSATASASGGTAPYTFSWMPVSQSGSVATALAAGTYSARVTDNRGCNTTSLVTVTQPASLTISTTQTNVACSTGSTGAITSSVTGGTTPYTYSWSPGGTTGPGITGKPAGTYTLLVTDQRSCVATRTIALTQPPAITVAMTATNETCSYLNNGIIAASVTGGASGYTYQWSPGGATTSLVTGQAAGSYSVIVLDASNCPASGTITVTQPSTLSVSLMNYSPVRCFGQSNGSVTAAGNGGTTPYTYSWSPSGITSPSLTNRAAGTYTVRVTDFNSCTVTAVQVITQPAVLAQSAVVNTVSCNGGSNAAVTVSATGGTGSYSYLWLPGAQTSSVLSPVAAGTYTAIVTDANTCTVSATYNVSQPLAITISLTQSAVACFSGSTGAVTSTVTGGHAPYTYSWSNGATTANISGLTAGVYTVTVTDNLSCVRTRTVSVTQPTQLNVSVTFTNESCDYSNNGVARAVASGGTPAYGYTWQPSAATTSVVTGLAAGIYTVTAGDNRGCTTSSQVTITEPPTLTANVSATAVSCFGGTNGRVQTVGSGGTPNYQYTLTPSNSTLSTVSGLAAGIYTATVRDSKGCIAQSTVEVTQPSALSATETVTNVSCFSGSNAAIAVAGTGGTSPYSYTWTPGGSTTGTVTGLAAGTYTVLVRDFNNCSFVKSYTITQPALLTISHTISPVSCFAGGNGSVTAEAAGGTGPYTYTWSNGPNTTSVNNVTAGTYTVIASDALSCVAIKTIAVTEPTQFVLATSFTNETCDYLDNGIASVSGSGGTPAYTFTWLPAAGNSTVYPNLAAGIYTVAAHDQNLCPAQATVAISQPTTLAVTFTLVTDASCSGYSNGIAQAIVTGGTPNYSYAWSSGTITTALNGSLAAGNHTVVVTDQYSCTASNTLTITEPQPLVIGAVTSLVQCVGGNTGAINLSINGGTSPYSNLIMPGNITGTNFSGLTSGTYTIFTTDNKGCVGSATVPVNEAPGMSTVVNFTNPACGLQNGVASISVTSGGLGPFSYSWAPAGGTASITPQIGPGSYTITVTDANTCTATKIVDLSNSSAPVIVIGTVTNVTCYNGFDAAISASVSSGVPPYSYSWSPIGGTTAIASNLPKGYYSLSVTDDVGCIGIITSSLIGEPPEIQTSVTTSVVSCNTGSNGAASAFVTGGTPGYTLTWSSGTASGNSVTGLTAGTYTLIVKDTKLCSDTVLFAITEPPSLSLTVGSSSVSCFSGTNGAASGTVTGGNGSYNYSWTPVNVSGQNLQNIGAGIYSITATDIKGCEITTTVEVIQPAQIVLVTNTRNSDCSLANGEATVSASGGIGAFTYTWLPANTSGSVAVSLPAGSHSVQVTDANLCPASATLTVADNPAPAVTISSATNVSCFNGSNGIAQATVTGGTGPFTFTWSPSGGNAATATGLAAGQYSLLVMSMNNCSVTAVAPLITQPAQLLLNVTTESVLCFGDNTGSATVTASGGTGAYTYTWGGGTPSGSITTGLSTDNYTVGAEDANNCPATASFAIAQPLTALASLEFTSQVSCNGGSNGSATVIPSGGSSPYNVVWTPGQVSSFVNVGMTAGSYTASVTDVNGCSITPVVNIGEPTSVTLTPSFLPSNCSGADGQATVVATGGTPPYSYQWTPSGGTGSVATGLSAGDYSVTVSDNLSCVSQVSTSITDLPSATVSVSAVSNLSCFNSANGTATAVVTGGSGPFSYQWSAGVGTTSVVTNLPAGQHTVVVTSVNSCTTSAVTPVVTQPDALVTQFNLSAVSCNGGSNGSAAATVFGGTSPYSYSWSPVNGSTATLQNVTAGTYSLLVTDANTCTSTFTALITEPTLSLALAFNTSSVLCNGNATGVSTVVATGGTSPYNYNWSPAASTASVAVGLTAGIYTVVAVDNNGCTEQGTVEVFQPAAALSLNVSVTDAPCFASSGGSASVTASGGTPAYSYTWSSGAGTTSVITGLAAGTYTTLVTDQNLCASVASFTVSQPVLLTATLIATDPSCNRNNGLLNAQVNGGTGPYNFIWNPSNTNSSSVSGLAPGAYTLVVSDINTCTASATASLTDIPGPVVAITSVTNVSCFGFFNGAASFTASSGTLPYSTQWLPLGGSTYTATQLAAGIYSASVTDSLGCVTIATVSVDQPDQLNIGVDSLRHVSCFGNADGAAFVSAYGGTGPYTYTWSSFDAGPAAYTLPAGTYTVEATDANKCTFTISATITEPDSLMADAVITRSILCFAGVGDASVTISGGTAPFNVNWNSAPPQNGTDLMSVPVGSYTVTITDRNGCTAADTLTFHQPSQIVTAVSQNDTICAGTTTMLTANASGGVGSYLYTWAPDGSITSGTLQIAGATDQTVTVVAFDQNGCAGSDAISIMNTYELLDGNVALLGHSPICPGESSVLQATVGGHPGPVTYSWSHSIPANPGPHVVTPTAKTTYSLAVTNICGTTVKKTFEVTIADPPVVMMTADSLAICAPGSIQFHEVGDAVNSADPVVYWSWDFGNGEYSGEKEPYFYFTDPGKFEVHLTVMTDHGCVGTSSVPLMAEVYPQPVASFSLNNTVLQLPYDELKCTNLSEGAVRYAWDFGGGKTSNLTHPSVRLEKVGETRIQLIAISAFGCSDTAVQVIHTSSDIVFPNAFTPTENGSTNGAYDVTSLNNNVFFPYTSGVSDYNLQIFDRWGELIFESTDLKIGWDGYYRGVLSQQGVYVWKAKCKLGDGRNFSQSGTVTLLRK